MRARVFKFYLRTWLAALAGVPSHPSHVHLWYTAQWGGGRANIVLHDSSSGHATRRPSVWINPIQAHKIVRTTFILQQVLWRFATQYRAIGAAQFRQCTASSQSVKSLSLGCSPGKSESSDSACDPPMPEVVASVAANTWKKGKGIISARGLLAGGTNCNAHFPVCGASGEGGAKRTAAFGCQTLLWSKRGTHLRETTPLG